MPDEDYGKSYYTSHQEYIRAPGDVSILYIVLRVFLGLEALVTSANFILALYCVIIAKPIIILISTFIYCFTAQVL